MNVLNFLSQSKFIRRITASYVSFGGIVDTFALPLFLIIIPAIAKPIAVAVTTLAVLNTLFF